MTIYRNHFFGGTTCKQLTSVSLSTVAGVANKFEIFEFRISYITTIDLSVLKTFSSHFLAYKIFTAGKGVT